MDLTFHIEATLSLDERTLKLMRVGVLGIVPVPVGQVIQDTTLPGDKGVLNVFGTGYETGYGGRNEPPNGVVGPLPSEIITAVNVSPYTASISAGTPTAQLQSIVQYQNYASIYVTSQGTWATSDAAVATVSAGLVTRVGSGSCTISCTFGGVESNAAAITST